MEEDGGEKTLKYDEYITYLSLLEIFANHNRDTKRPWTFPKLLLGTQGVRGALQRGVGAELVGGL